MFDNLSKAVHAFPIIKLTILSVDEILLPDMWKGLQMSFMYRLMNLPKIRIPVWFGTPQSINHMATCLPSWKPSKLDEPDMQDTAGEAGTSS